MSEVFLPENCGRQRAYIANVRHFYRDMAVLLALLNIRPVIVQYTAAKPEGRLLN